MARDYNLLADVFYLPATRRRVARAPKPVHVGGVLFHVERESSHRWTGWFDGCSDTFEASTRRELLADAESNGPPTAV